MAIHIGRRKFIAALGGTAVAWPLAAHAQQPMPVVGYFYPSTPEAGADLVAAFRKGLSETGYVEGRNVTIEYAWAHNESSRVPELAAELVRRRVSVIVAATLNTALAVKAATTTIPIVFNATGDPITTGLVASLNRPGGNATGISSLGGELGSKRFGLLRELVPKAARFALLVNTRARYAQSMIEETQAAASAIGGQFEAFTADTAREIDAAFASLTQKRAEALVVGLSALFVSRRVQMTTLAAQHRLPTIYALRDFVEAGGLMSYGPSLTDSHRQVGIYTGRILKGARPADLPVLQPTKFELVINLQTARALGIEVPPTLLARADEVIE
jgi:ABC-type uncharacterized transport system substrate-binding protein